MIIEIIMVPNEYTKSQFCEPGCDRKIAHISISYINHKQNDIYKPQYKSQNQAQHHHGNF